MAEKDDSKDAADYGIGVPVKKHGFFLKGLDHVDWGMKDRLSRIFNPKSGHTVMLAFDHGYIMGPTSGLERMDLTITPLIEYADCIMCSRGALRSIVPPTSNKAVSLRYSAGDCGLSMLPVQLQVPLRSLKASTRAGLGLGWGGLAGAADFPDSSARAGTERAKARTARRRVRPMTSSWR